MVKLDGVVDQQLRERTGVAAAGVEPETLSQLRGRVPVDDRPRPDLLHVVEQLIDELVGEKARRIVELHAFRSLTFHS